MPVIPMRHLNPDVFLRISEFLHTSGDRLALARTSRWHYSVLGHTAYTHVVVSQGLKIASLIAILTSNDKLCDVVFHLDMIIPKRPEAPNHSQAAILLWRTRETKLIHGALVILKLAINLKSVYFQNPRGYHTGWDTVDTLLQDPYPCLLGSFSTVHTSKGTLEFVRKQTELAHLTVLSDINDLTVSEAEAPLSIPRLRTLWATPGWSRMVLPSSPVQSFGLVHGDIGQKERSNWRVTVDSLMKMGGHPTVNCLTLPYEDFFWDHESVNLAEYGFAFPGVTKLCITLAGFGAERLVSQLELQ